MHRNVSDTHPHRMLEELLMPLPRPSTSLIPMLRYAARLALCSLLLQLIFDTANANPDNSARIKMCPAGGSTFTLTKLIACSMRRKRSAGFFPVKRALIAPSIRQLQSICCDIGCTVNDLLAYCGPINNW